MPIKSADVFPVCEHMDALVEELRLRIPAALQEFDENSVHKARVATRRLKAALELLQSELNQHRTKPFARLGRKLRRRLGPLRDADVMIGHLEEIKSQSKLAPACEWFKLRLIAQREQARSQSSEKSTPADVLSRLGSWWAIRPDVIEASPAVSTLLGQSLHAQLERFISQATLSLGTDPHQLRIAGKSLRYTLELAEAEGHKLPKMILKTFKNLQEHLGTWHDFVVLAERAMQACLDEDLPLHDPAMQKQVLKLMDYAMTNSQRELDRFSSLWAKHGGEISKTIQELFPQTEPATVLQTDHDPADSPTPPAPEQASPIVPPAA